MSKFPNDVYEATIQLAEQHAQNNTTCSMYELANVINVQTNNNFFQKAAASPKANEFGMYTVVKEAYWYAQQAYKGSPKADFVKQVYVTKKGNPIIK